MIGTDRSAVGLRAGAADGSEEVEPSNGEERTGRSLWPEVDFFGGMLRRLTEGYSVADNPMTLVPGTPAATGG